MQALEHTYEGLRALDEFVAKASRLSEVARLAKLEVRLREYLTATWNRRAREATKKAAALAGKGATPAKIARAVADTMAKWAPEVLPTVHREVDQAYRLALAAGWKKATGQTRATLAYDKPAMDLVEVAKRVEFKASPSFDVIDQAAVGAMQGQQTFWIGEHYSKSLSLQIEQTSKEVMLQAGNNQAVAAKLMRQRIADDLGHVRIPKGFNGSASSYFEGLAANAVTNARAHGQIASITRVGYTRVEIVNPVDRRTCPVCLHMNGRTFTTVQASQTSSAVMSATTPEQVKEALPWKDPETGKRRTIDDVKRIAPGPPGKHSKEDADALTKAGFNIPPFHFKCRCAVDVDVTSDIEGPAPLPAGPGAKPVPAIPANLAQRAPIRAPPPKSLDPKKIPTENGDVRAWAFEPEGFHFKGTPPIEELAAALENDRAFQLFSLAMDTGSETYMSTLASTESYLAQLSPDAVKKAVRATVRQLVKQWNYTSGDHSALSLAMQNAAQAEFGLEAATAHFHKTTLADAVREFSDKGWEPALRKFLRTQYDYTQAALKAQGVDDMLVIRGVKMRGELPPGVALDGKAAAAVVEHQPMSSYSFEATTAHSFAGAGEPAALLTTRVPRERVLSLGGRGMGAADEAEVVVLGSKTDEVRYVGWKFHEQRQRTEESIWGWLVEGMP